MVIKLEHGDALELIKGMDDESIDLTITDTPWGVGFDKRKGGFDDSPELVFRKIIKIVKDLYRVQKKNTHAYLFVPSLEMDKWMRVAKRYFKLKAVVSVKDLKNKNRTYVKDNFDQNNQCILYLSKGKRKFNKVNFIRTSESWLNDKRNKNPQPFTYHYPAFFPDYVRASAFDDKIHPHTKNLDLTKILICLSSKEGETVFDPFMGSGTTIIGAKMLRRNGIGFELVKKWYNLALNNVNGVVVSENIFNYVPNSNGKGVIYDPFLGTRSYGEMSVKKEKEKQKYKDITDYG